MKYIFFLIFTTISVSTMLAQSKMDTIEVGYFKPPLLIFSDTASCSYGSEDIEVVEKSNQVLVKALKENFEETNLYVKSNGKYYVFVVRYTEDPVKFLYDFQEESQAQATHHNLVSKKEAEKQRADSLNRIYEKTSVDVFERDQNIFKHAVYEHDMAFLISNMYIKGNRIYIKLGIENNTDISYNIEFVRFEIRNTDKSLKSSSEQKIQVEPVYTYKEVKKIYGREYKTPVYVIEKLALDKNRKLHIEVWEKGGDRILQLELNHKDILRIKDLD